MTQILKPKGRLKLIQLLKERGDSNSDKFPDQLMIMRSDLLQWLEEVKGNKQPVGYTPIEEVPFSQSNHPISAGDLIYLFSDGYADQFGGLKGKKYKYKTLREKLAQISTLPFSEQKKMIVDEFHAWKGDLEQLDDVCLLGIKV